MSTDEKLPFPWTPFPWTPIPASAPMTPATPRRSPTRGDRPTAPLPLRTLPPRVLPTSDVAPPGVQTTSVVPVPTAPAPTEVGTGLGASGGPRSTCQNTCPTGALTLAAAVRHGIALHKQDTMQTLFDLDRDDLDALVDAGVLLEVVLGAGLTRYALADDLPAAASPERSAA